MLSLGFVTGSEPDKWVRRYSDTTAHGGVDARGLADPVPALERGELDVAIVRLPDARIDDRFHTIALYEEQLGVAVPKGSVYAEVGEPVSREDVADEIVNYRLNDEGVVDIPALAEALQVVAANVGIAIAPRPALKVLSKRQIKHLPFIDPDAPTTSIALVFARDQDSDAIQDFVGVAKGRTANSSRQAAPKRSAREKALAKQARREQAGKTGKTGKTARTGRKPTQRRRGRR